MAGISSRAANTLENLKKFNGIEQNSALDLNLYDAFYRNLDPQIGRFWQIDPEIEAQESYSPYESMGNNPVNNIDPLGDFKTRFGAWLHKVFNGGGSIGENHFGEWYINKSRTEFNADGSPTVVGSKYYGKNRDEYSTARERLLKELDNQRVREDLTETGIWDPLVSQSKAKINTLGIAVGVWLPNVFIRSSPIRFGNTNATKVGTVEQVTGGIKIRFGNNTNQIHHVFRHTDEMGLSRNAVQKAVEEHLPTVISKIKEGQPLNEVVEVAGQRIQYTAFKLNDGVINVGRIHAAK